MLKILLIFILFFGFFNFFNAQEKNNTGDWKNSIENEIKKANAASLEEQFEIDDSEEKGIEQIENNTPLDYKTNIQHANNTNLNQQINTNKQKPEENKQEFLIKQNGLFDGILPKIVKSSSIENSILPFKENTSNYNKNSTKSIF